MVDTCLFMHDSILSTAYYYEQNKSPKNKSQLCFLATWCNIRLFFYCSQSTDTCSECTIQYCIQGEVRTNWQDNTWSTLILNILLKVWHILYSTLYIVHSIFYNNHNHITNPSFESLTQYVAMFYNNHNHITTPSGRGPGRRRDQREGGTTQTQLT